MPTSPTPGVLNRDFTFPDPRRTMPTLPAQTSHTQVSASPPKSPRLQNLALQNGCGLLSLETLIMNGQQVDPSDVPVEDAHTILPSVDGTAEGRWQPSRLQSEPPNNLDPDAQTPYQDSSSSSEGPEQDVKVGPSEQTHSRSSAPPSYTSVILDTSVTLPLGRRFAHLLNHIQNIVQANRYHLNNGQLISTPKPIDNLTARRFTHSLSCAQDALSSPQPSGSCLPDLKIFTSLWTTALALLDSILDSNQLSHEIFGWGIMGLAAGYLDREQDQLFVSQKQRLEDGLKAIPELESSVRNMTTSTSENAKKIGRLRKARSTVHVCSIMMLQSMRKEGWKSVKWAYIVPVVEGWVRHLGWDENECPCKGEDVDVVAEVEDRWEEKEGLWFWKDNAKEKRPGLHKRSKSMV